MTTAFRLCRAPLAALLILTAGAALAAPVPISGEDPLAPYAVLPGSLPDLAQQAFLNHLIPSSVLREDFQNYAVDSTSLTGLFGGLPGSSLTGGGRIEDQKIPGGTTTGRFSTSPGCTPDANNAGCNWWEASATFTLVFGRQVSAFGFFGTDIGDFDGSLSLTLIDNGVELETLQVKGTAQNGMVGPVSTPRPQSTPTETSLLFYGFTDRVQSYDTIRFNITQGGTTTDFLGFDDLIIGNLAAPGTLPEPTSLALVALSLAALAASRRKKAQR